MLCYYTECHCDDCRYAARLMLIVNMFSVIMSCAFMLIAIVPSVVILSVNTLSVFLLNHYAECLVDFRYTVIKRYHYAECH